MQLRRTFMADALNLVLHDSQIKNKLNRETHEKRSKLNRLLRSVTGAILEEASEQKTKVIYFLLITTTTDLLLTLAGYRI